MKRSFLKALAVMSVAVAAASATAGEKNRGGLGRVMQSFGGSSISGLRQQFQSGSGISNMISSLKHHHKKDKDKKPPVPLDPGRGDGRVPVEPTTPPARPGFVWVNDHWERERAPKPLGNPNGSTWTDNYGPNVRDHRTSPPPPMGNFPGAVRDHRSNASMPGGVTVTSTGRPRGNSIPTFQDPLMDALSRGASAVGKGASSVGSALGDLFSTEVGDPPQQGTGPVIRDHRTPPPSNFPGTIRDHRTAAPSNFSGTVRDHRTGFSFLDNPPPVKQ
jgi:hypothetical protein